MHLANSSVNGPENKFKLKLKIIMKQYLIILFTFNDKLFYERYSITKVRKIVEKSLSCLDLVPVSLL